MTGVAAPGDIAAGACDWPAACNGTAGGSCAIAADEVSQSDGISTAALSHWSHRSHPITPRSSTPGMSTKSSTTGMSTVSRSSNGSCIALNAVYWDEMRLGHRIKPAFKYAHRVSDVYLLSSFLDLAKCPDINCDATKLLLRTVKMLRACDFSNEDICSVLAHASAYFKDTFAICGDSMDASEVGNVMALLIFLAHSYVQDETCRLRIWHKYLFAKYCSLEMLNSAVLRLLEIRNYILRLEEEDLAERYGALLRATTTDRLRGISLDSGSSYSGSPALTACSPCSSSRTAETGGSGGVSTGVGASSDSSGARCRGDGKDVDGDSLSSAVRALDFAA